MENPRKYGNPPYVLALLHGGPGAPGEMSPVARELGGDFGVLEPLQEADSLEGQLSELALQLAPHTRGPITLAGHSWGAMLAFMFCARNPGRIKKLILISSGAFEARYARGVTHTRLDRLGPADRLQAQVLVDSLGNPRLKEKDAVFGQYGKIISKADAYDSLPQPSGIIQFQSRVFLGVWPQVERLRKSGKLLEMGRNITCPVLAIHGDYDPTPYQGVIGPLSGVLKDFKHIILPRCGHTPWRERWASERFYEIMRGEVI